MCEPAAAWHWYIGESSIPQTPWDPSEATFAVTDDQPNHKIQLAQAAENIIFGSGKFFEKIGLGVPRNRRNSGKVVEGSTIMAQGLEPALREVPKGFSKYE